MDATISIHQYSYVLQQNYPKNHRYQERYESCLAIKKRKLGNCFKKEKTVGFKLSLNALKVTRRTEHTLKNICYFGLLSTKLSITKGLSHFVCRKSSLVVPKNHSRYLLLFRKNAVSKLFEARKGRYHNFGQESCFTGSKIP